MRKLIRIGVSYSHTRILKVFSVLCRFAYQHEGTIITKIDAPKIKSLVKKELGAKHEREVSVIKDYLKTAEAMGLMSKVRRTRYSLTDYGLLIACDLSKDEFRVFPLTDFERMFFLQMLIRKDFDYLYTILPSLLESQSLIVDALKVLFMNKARLGSLKEIRSVFKSKLKQRIDSLHLAVEGKELKWKVSKWRIRTLNHRISSRIFWLVEIMAGNEFDPHSESKCAREILEKLNRLKMSLKEIEAAPFFSHLIDENFPEIFAFTFGKKIQVDINNQLASRAITEGLNQNWEALSKLEPKKFGNRISALPFLLLIQGKLLMRGIALPLSRIAAIFRQELFTRGYILVLRRDFHSGHIEKTF